MKIDEAINFVENMMYLYRPTGEQHDKWCELLNLLRWYRKQDLIRREDAVNKVKEYSSNWCGSYEPFDKEEALSILKRIPTAEPHCALCDYSAIDDYYLCALCEYKDEKSRI